MNYGIIYHSNRNTRREYTMSCTCGYNGEIDYSPYSMHKCACPQCGNTNLKAEDKYYNCFHKKEIKHFFWDVDINVKEKEIHVIKTNTRTIAKLDEEDGFYKIKVENQDVIRLDFNVQDVKLIKLTQNGVEKKITKNTISSALSHIEISSAEEKFSVSFLNTIFQEFYWMSGIDQLSTVVWFLYLYPQYEILYNTYKNLRIFTKVNKKDLNSGNNPSEILNLPKPVLREMVEVSNHNNAIFLYTKQIQNFSVRLKNKPDIVRKLIQLADATDCSMIDKLVELYDLNYDLTRLKEYLIEDIYTFQGIDSPKEGLQLLYDYIHMCQLMNVSFEKYPRSLKLRHDMANKNLKIQVSDIEAKEMELILNSKEYKELEFDDKKSDYIVMAPSCYQDIIEEGQHLHHCVGSYVDYVRKKTTKILFMRHRSEKEKSLVTLEVRNGELRQYAGSCDRQVTEIEMEFLKEYCKKKNLRISDTHARYDNL